MKKCALVCLPSAKLSYGLRLKDRGEVDLKEARRQHQRYCKALEVFGYSLIRLAPDPRYPDSVFVEDPAVVFEDVLVRARLYRPERQGEEDRIERVLKPLFSQALTIDLPGFLEGGDVLVTPGTLYIGLSGRTNIEGAEQLARIAKKTAGYTSVILEVPGNQLHLKGAVSYHPDTHILTVSEDIAASFRKRFHKKVVIPTGERFGANCIASGSEILLHAGRPKTKKILEKAGFSTREVALSEFEKIDGAMSCLSKLFR